MELIRSCRKYHFVFMVWSRIIMNSVSWMVSTHISKQSNIYSNHLCFRVESGEEWNFWVWVHPLLSTFYYDIKILLTVIWFPLTIRWVLPQPLLVRMQTLRVLSIDKRPGGKHVTTIKMTTPSRKLRHSAKASLTVFISEREGGVQKLLISMFYNIM